MASVKPSKAAGLAPLKTGAASSIAISPLCSPPAAQSPAGLGGVSALSTPTSAQSPHTHSSDHAPTPTQTPTLLPASASTSSAPSPHPHPHPHPHHQHPIQSQPQPPHLRIAIQPAPARRSLPTSSLSAGGGAANQAPATPLHKMSMASVISPMPGPPPPQAPISMTTKEWVIPPRPKPGRKPATDTPPTKRKAQNRAAQRAFRERRAARVGELEEQLEADSLEHERIQQALQDKVRRLEMDAQALQSRCEVLENMLDKERAERSKEVEALRNRLHEAVQQHPRQQSLPSISSVPQHAHTFAPQPLRHHRPSAPSRLHDGGRASASSLLTTASGSSARVSPTRTHRPATTHSFSIAQIISPPEDIEQAPTGCGNCEPTGPCACADEAIASVNVGCGNCTLGSRCQCLEEVLNGGTHASAGHDNRAASVQGARQATSRTAKRTIRSISPSSIAPEEKRPRGTPTTTTATEIDFTAMFSRKPSQRPRQPLPPPVALAPVAPTPYTLTTAVDSPRPEDPCGFCEDGTYCACAEAAASYSNNNNNNSHDAAPAVADEDDDASSLTLPALNSSAFTTAASRTANGQTRTPPPSEGDAIGYEILPDGSVKLPSLRRLQAAKPAAVAATARAPALASSTKKGGCGPSGPGTCAQCLSDPVSGLFCRSLAASFKNGGGGSGGGCCGGGGASGGCCKDKPASSSSSTSSDGSSSTSSLGLSLSCADAYKTLASHKHFPEAADDISTWLPRLKAREPQVGAGGRGKEGVGRGRGRAPIEVEAASIMSVLKGFDVRFGRGE